MSENTIYNFLSANKKAAIAAFKVLRKLKGLKCIVKTPISKGSIFGLEDVVEYDEFVTKEDQLLIFGIFTEGTAGMEGYDTFLDGTYVLTLAKDKMPLQTQIEVRLCNLSMTFKVDDHKDPQPTCCEKLFVKNMLVPAT